MRESRGPRDAGDLVGLTKPGSATPSSVTGSKALTGIDPPSCIELSRRPLTLSSKRLACITETKAWLTSQLKKAVYDFHLQFPGAGGMCVTNTLQF